ncbi:MAG: hypothetical protein Q7V62_05750 [Actinomycetota bacterium]|nr:hypothetical protein [Actinomycetota bacterium]
MAKISHTNYDTDDDCHSVVAQYICTTRGVADDRVAAWIREWQAEEEKEDEPIDAAIADARTSAAVIAAFEDLQGDDDFFTIEIEEVVLER